MGTYRFETRTAASPQRAFALWTDLDRMKEWVGGVTGVSDVSGPVDRVGTTYTVHIGGMKSRTEVLDVQRPVRFRTRFGNRILKGENTTTFAPDGDGTLITEELETHGVISAIFAWIFASGSYRGSFRSELEAFARLAER